MLDQAVTVWRHSSIKLNEELPLPVDCKTWEKLLKKKKNVLPAALTPSHGAVI